MSKPCRPYRLLGTFALMLLAFGSAATPSHAKDGDIRFRCKAKGPSEIAIHARYEERARSKGLRQKFEAEFEARAGGSFISGQQISIVVDAISVGSFVLTLAASGELSGQIEFDSKPSTGHVPFPANFPDVAAGSMVEAKLGTTTILGCELQ